MVVQMGRTAPQAKAELLSPVDAQHFAALPCRSHRHGREFDICQTPSATCPRESVLPIWLRPDFLVVFEGYAGGAVNRPMPRKAHRRSLQADILRTC